MLPPTKRRPHPVAEGFSPCPAELADPGRERPPGRKRVAEQTHGERNQAAQGSPGARKAARTAAAMRDIAAPAAYGAHGNDRVVPPTPRAMRTDLPPCGDLRRLNSYRLSPDS